MGGDGLSTDLEKLLEFGFSRLEKSENNHPTPQCISTTKDIDLERRLQRETVD